MSFLFSSESVSEGHPDKICDQISDAVLDAALSQDPESRVAVECFIATGLVVVGGEMRSRAILDIQKIVRQTLRDIGYQSVEAGIDADHCAVLAMINEQSPDIAQGVDEGTGLDTALGAGDQGIMFGHACRQTEEMMPLPIILSHRLLQRLAVCRRSGELPYLRPDAKAQVTVEYGEDRQPKRVDTVVLSTQHAPVVEHAQLTEDIRKVVIETVVPKELLDEKTRYLINPTGRFVIGGPYGDTGLTGRKIVADTYGGWVSHGGGAFSGKDGTKVDRSAAYMARYMAKNCVAAGVADELDIQLAYAIGVPEPVSIRIQTFGTSSYSEAEILAMLRTVFDMSVSGIIQTLKLTEPRFKSTACYGHFGRNDIDLTWETLDKVSHIQACLDMKKANI